jgi:hypothetical protein
MFSRAHAVMSVFAFPSGGFEDAASVLDSLAGRSDLGESVEWVFEEVLWIYPRSETGELWLDWTSEAMDQLESNIGPLPAWGLQIDISSRVDGHREVLTVLNVLLERGGHAVDDYSDHPWTLDEINTDAARHDARTFLRPRPRQA